MSVRDIVDVSLNLTKNTNKDLEFTPVFGIENNISKEKDFGLEINTKFNVMLNIHVLYKRVIFLNIEYIIYLELKDSVIKELER